MASKRLQREEQCYSKNYLSEMPSFHAKMRLKSAPQKLNFLMEKATSKSCTRNALARSSILAHSNAASLFIKTILC